MTSDRIQGKSGRDQTAFAHPRDFAAARGYEGDPRPWVQLKNSLLKMLGQGILEPGDAVVIGLEDRPHVLQARNAALFKMPNAGCDAAGLRHPPLLRQRNRETPPRQPRPLSPDIEEARGT